MSLKQITKFTSYKENVYQQLKAAIISQKLKQGEQLNERALANELGISRTPIREALHLLENEGWVVSEPCKGTWVKEITTQDLDEVFQMRLAFEALAVELAVEHLTEERCVALRRLLALQVTTGIEAEPFTDVDMELHLYLAEISDNRRLFQTTNGLMDVMGIYIIHTIRKPERYIAAAEEHKAIIQAILDRDATRAKEAMVYHINQARAVINESFKKTDVVKIKA